MGWDIKGEDFVALEIHEVEERRGWRLCCFGDSWSGGKKAFKMASWSAAESRCRWALAASSTICLCFLFHDHCYDPEEARTHTSLILRITKLPCLFHWQNSITLPHTILYSTNTEKRFYTWNMKLIIAIVYRVINVIFVKSKEARQKNSKAGLKPYRLDAWRLVERRLSTWQQ